MRSRLIRMDIMNYGIREKYEQLKKFGDGLSDVMNDHGWSCTVYLNCGHSHASGQLQLCCWSVFRRMIQQNLLIHVARRTTVMAIHAPNRDGIVAFSCQKAVLHHQPLTPAESLKVIRRIMQVMRSTKKGLQLQSIASGCRKKGQEVRRDDWRR